MATETWELWYPKAGATGLPIARGRIDQTTTLLTHAAPPHLTVIVRDEYEQVVAEGTDLAATAETPITRLRRVGERIEREDIWPTDADLGTVVVLVGGEAGILERWWHADDHSEWRWSLELYNHR